MKAKISKLIKIILSHISPTLISKYLYYRTTKEFINLKSPQNFNEKLMWLKLNDYNHNELVWKCSDKYLVREYATKCGISKKNLPKLHNVYNNVKEIDINELPNRFALKCTHGCGFNIICLNKNELNIKETKKQLNKWQHTKFGYETGELHYTHVKPKILCEQFIDNGKKLPYDYKLYCFNGEVKLVLVCSNRERQLCLNFYDLNWKELMIGKEVYRSQKKIKKPNCFEEMIEIAQKLSKSFTFVRIDFYEYDDTAILGEMTFTPAACIATYYNDYGNEYLGNLIKLK